MIQRIQTVWLLFGMACGVMLFYFPFWEFTGDAIPGMDTIGAKTQLYLLAFLPVIFITHAIAIWSFKKRRRQIRLCNINVVLFILFTVTGLVVVKIENPGMSAFHALWHFHVGALLPFVGIVFNFMARSRIKKDEDLIRSMDRLR